MEITHPTNRQQAFVKRAVRGLQHPRAGVMLPGSPPLRACHIRVSQAGHCIESPEIRSLKEP
ncbi:hypothetical protein HNQ92_005312 [Rhabdobacter roseus]|uniref:Uncharacterized protein n=1 Tax=Rhabdobacter roseus TaxID=1655419 RepID=A0A840U4Y8_9BACT|nr:hypothetical protein [Rhabdobacter roseus]MBB5287150.1 hypothetical protein [Rhabdobacter roseus]